MSEETEKDPTETWWCASNALTHSNLIDIYVCVYVCCACALEVSLFGSKRFKFPRFQTVLKNQRVKGDDGKEKH